MSNTGYKGISSSTIRGDVVRLQVSVQWKSRVRRATIWCKEGHTTRCLGEALTQRMLFEDELGKPRTERHIRGHKKGVHREIDVHGNASWASSWAGRRKHFAVKKYGEQEAKRLAYEERGRLLNLSARME